ncbi:hypothetical protein GCM10027515_03820 [Schumannella luteola]|uniref:Uncharacterized protein n=1 Tax=Schumannella luteola TaxID=472059 RepID=A0A852Y7Y3_9MICO|nr:hypothetical protein [Schumannella luteola]NYG98483.1 hypothetical protein [Schumannella luteola]TPX01291.1 hypothetical protein FJ656_28280 [Schumannella luteola]
MPFRAEETIQNWVDEFLELEYDSRGLVRVLPQDTAGGENSGLVAVRLESIDTSIFIQPREIGSSEWVTTLEQSDTMREFTASQLTALSAELIMVSALTAFLEAKSRELSAENRGAGVTDSD